MALPFERIDLNHDGVISRNEFNSYIQAPLTLSAVPGGPEVQRLPSSRIQRVEGAIVRSATLAASPVQPLMPEVRATSPASSPISGTLSGPPQLPQVNLQPRVVPVEQAAWNQHCTALSSVLAPKDEHQHLQTRSLELAQQEQQQQLHALTLELQQRLDEDTGGVRAELLGLQAMVQSQQEQLQEQLTELRREAKLLGSQQQQQSVQMQDLESQVVRHLQGLREQQQSEAMLLRQDLEATLAAGSPGEGLLELRGKCEELSRSMELALHSSPSRQVALPTDHLEALDVERCTRARELGELSSFLQEEREERIRIDEELDARRQQASEETLRAMNAALDDVRAEMRALAEQMLRQGPDRAELEGLVARAVRPERDARAELARALEAERGGRVQDLENERDARIREAADIRASIQRLSDGLVATLPESTANIDDLIRQQIDCSLLEHKDFSGVVADLERLSRESAVTEKSLAEASQRMGNVEHRLGDLDSLMRAMEHRHESSTATWNDELATLRAMTHQGTPAVEEPAVSGPVGAMRDELDALRGSVARELEALRGGFDQRAAVASRNVEGDSARDDIALLHQELGSLRAIVEALAVRENPVEQAIPDAAVSALQLSMGRLEAALQSETMKRCEVTAELFACIRQETAEVASRIEQVAQEFQEARDQQSSVGAVAGVEAARAAEISRTLAESLHIEVRSLLEQDRAELTKVVQTERNEHFQESSSLRAELQGAMEKEHADCMIHIAEVRMELTKAVTKERDERLAEDSDQRTSIARMLREWHNALRAEQAKLVSGEMSVLPELAAEPEMLAEPGPPEPAHGEDGTSLLSRFFRRSRNAAAAEA